jgi:two-component system nitrogen regulation response regulator NtrX
MTEANVLIVDDEEGIRESLAGIFEDEGYSVVTASTGGDALKIVKEQAPDLILLDIWMKGIDGIHTLKEIKDLNPDLPVIMISGHGNIELAVKATQSGAYDFLEKPLSLERVLLVAQRALEKRTLEIENRELKKDLGKKWKLIGNAQKIKQLREQIDMAAKSNSRVLILGESGSGKELVAHILHETSQRVARPFVEMNCAAIPQELIESELFGHEKGSFTGAFERKKGKFELADEGTLVIETQEFQRVGGSKNIKVDVRIISATNKDLFEEVKKGSFREDLLYRLNVIPILVPPLRERKDDIPELVGFFLEYFAIEYGQKPKKISPDGLKVFEAYDWPGNIRELRNLIERLVIMTPSNIITAKNIMIGDTVRSDYFALHTLKEARESFEKDFIAKKLEENSWNISKTAEILDIERSNLHRKIKGYDIKTP